MTDFKLRDFREPPYYVPEAQVVVHAISNLLHLDYQPIFEGVEAVKVSRRMCNIFKSLGVSAQPQSDIGHCLYQLQNLIVLVCEHGLSPQRIERECNSVLPLYPAKYVTSIQQSSLLRRFSGHNRHV